MMRRDGLRIARVSGWLGACALCAISAPSSFAQAPAETASEAASAAPVQELTDAEVRARMREVLREHDRLRHPDGEPQRFIGNEQEGNDLRSPTPALVNADSTPVLYEEDELRDRTLALYEDHASFTEAPHPIQALPSRTLARKAKPRDAKAATPEPEHGGAAWWLPVVMGGAVGVFLFVRARSR